ncbi:SMI1/KNR4 family protein [Streptomyces sp. NPDC050844]|uniref:SMI1/KNR4 family protein n=1 Tax=Streptomyces sp. NPDC050844 TaxID=3155790 RepID=UPI0033D51CDE
MGGIWTGVRERVLALREAPNRRLVFGADAGRYGHGFELSPVLTEEQVRAVERRLGFGFPPEYRSFLLEVGEGGAGPDYGLFPVRPMGPAAAEPAAPQGTGPEGTAPEGTVPKGAPAEDTAPEARHHEPPFRPELTQELDAHESAEPQRAAYADTTEGEARFVRDYRAWDARHDELHDELTEGTLCVSEQGCAYYTLLAVTGPERGTIWDDVRAVGEGVVPIRHKGKDKERVTFAEWYLHWLAYAERRALAEQPD